MAAPNGSRRPAPAAGAAELRACEERAGEDTGEDGAGEVTFSRASADGSRAALAGLPEPVAASPATVPAAMTAQAPSATSTSRMGARGGLEPERGDPACLPFVLETDVLTTIPIVSSQRSQPIAGG